MLVLRRRTDEAIVLTLPDGTRIRVVCNGIVKDGAVRFGTASIAIDAPPHIKIHREELIDEPREVDIDAVLPIHGAAGQRPSGSVDARARGRRRA